MQRSLSSIRKLWDARALHKPWSCNTYRVLLVTYAVPSYNCNNVSSGYTGHTVSVSTVVVFVPKLNHRSTGDWAFRKIISMESYKQAFVLTPEILPFKSFFAYIVMGCVHIHLIKRRTVTSVCHTMPRPQMQIM